MVAVSVIGLGPWGLCALERLVNEARGTPEVGLEVHVVEPGHPGGGMYSEPQPDYLVLNTPCGQHSMHPFPERLDEAGQGRGFYEWVTASGYRWYGDQCRRSGPAGQGRTITPHDFLPRRLMGQYLEWFYESLVSALPHNVVIVHHRGCAIDVEPTSEGGERVHLDGGRSFVVDHVIVTTGHTETKPDHGLGSLVTAPYPLEGYLGSTSAHEKVAVEGMGLVALDVVTALTVGLGGRYTAEPGGRLRYHPSGREPSLYLFSRSGFPYCAKSFGATDPMGDYRPAICTFPAVAALADGGAPGRKRRIDARQELLPLVLAEMELCYYSRAAQLDSGLGAGEQVRDNLIEAWAAGTFAEERDRLGARYGAFDARAHLFAGEGLRYRDSEDYEAEVYATVAEDTRHALVEGGGSPVKAALETLRALRDTMRRAVEWKGLTLSSHLDFFANLHNRFARLVAGPPAFRSQQLLALVDAGIVKMPFGPSPEVLPTPDGRALVRSTQLEHPFEVAADRLVRAHLDLPSISPSTSPLLANLVHRGRLRPLDFDGTPVGSIDLDQDCHPIGAKGRVQPRLWVFGVLTEGVRYFTLYIPSPKSRARAFLDAGACAHTILGRGAGTRIAGAGTAFPGAGRPAEALRIALVNNMPDGAFEETEHRFRHLVESCPSVAARVECFTLPGVPRGPVARRRIEEAYGELADLYDNPPDALVVTGAEPKKAELTEELYWPALQGLLYWGRSIVPSILLSCLTAHAALWTFNGLSRRLLLDKCSGVFAQEVDRAHPLMAGVGAVSLPHSRFNEVPTRELVGAGYRVLARSSGCGWTAAVGESGGSELLLLQGHPEYTPHTLLREYRRDVRRYLSGAQGSYPHIPTGYLDAQGVTALEQFRRDVTSRPRDPAYMEELPFNLAAAHVDVAWEEPAMVVMGNWLGSVAARVGAPRAWQVRGAFARPSPRPSGRRLGYVAPGIGAAEALPR
ncbi:MAG: homoserine O-acetyltransferase/O-succinyltransferase family protein [Acidimicrobiales bacterium]